MSSSNSPHATPRRLTVRLVATGVIAGFLVAVPVSGAQAAPACAASAADEKAALQVAAACRTKVEVLSEKTEYALGYAMPDGSKTLEIAVEPQRVKRAGAWQSIDTSLRVGAGGRLRPVATMSDVSFSPGGDVPLVTIADQGRRFELSWPSTLPAPVVSGSTATYRDVLAGVDLTVTATRAGYQHVLVAKTEAALRDPALTAIRYKTSGELKPSVAGDGSLTLADATGVTVPWVSHAASMWDSSYAPGLAGEVLADVAKADSVPASTSAGAGPAARSAPVGVRVSGSDLLVVPDAELLRTAKVPLFIDPPWQNTTAPTFAYADNPNTNWDVGNQAWVGRNPYDGRLFRSFFAFNISALLGKRITSARFDSTLTHNWACAGNTAYLYRSGGIATTPRTAWSPGLLVSLASAWGDSNEAGGCGADRGDDRLLFGSGAFTTDLHNVAAGGSTSYTVGLCMCTNSGGANENVSTQWMKFIVANSNLVVGYNSYPGTPADLKTSGVACGGTVGTTSPQLRAQYVDADGTDNLTGNFEFQEIPSGAVVPKPGPVKPANNYGDVTLSLGAASEGKTYQWRVQTTDGTDTSPWSSWCNFTVNASPPPVPGVSSTAYPTGATANGGPGVAGAFTFSNGGMSGADITSYTYGWTDPPAETVAVAAGASATLSLTPPRYGYNTLHVFSKDPSGTPGPTAHYQFLVGSPSAPIASWPLDTVAGHGYNDQAGGANLTVQPTRTDVVWSPDLRFHGENAVSFDTVAESPANVGGTLWAPVAALDTSKAFSVSAWVRPAALPTGNSQAVGQDGVDVGGFYLGIRQGGAPFGPRWSFTMWDTSVNTSTGRAAYGAVLGATDLNRWTHLMGVFDPAEHKVRLYVNGVLAGEVQGGATPWKATGNVTVGRGSWLGGPSDGWKGQVADVRMWSRVAGVDDLWGTNANAGAGTQATTGVLSPTEVGNWNFAGGADCFCGDVGDGAYWGRRLYLNGWDATPAGTAFVAGHDGDDALWFNGTSGSASTTDPGNGVQRPVVRTDNSFAVSAWVKPDSVTGANKVIVRQGNAANTASAFKLQLNGANGKWVFDVTTPNGAGGYVWTTAVSDAVATAGVWTHVTGVFNLATGEVVLYVNGVAQASKGTGAAGWSSDGSLLVGRGATNEYFDGAVDQVRVLSGFASAREIGLLYTS
jgi:hypothetical protein